MPDPQRVTIRPVQGGDEPLVCLLGEASPHLTAGYGGWEEHARPKRRALLDWTGTAVRRLELELVLDAFGAGGYVEAECRRLDAWATSDHASVPPAKLRIDGAAVPRSDLTWVIDTLDWGDAIRAPAGSRQRQNVTVTFAQAVETTQLARIPRVRPRRTRAKLKAPGSRGIQRMAAEELGAARKWRSIATLNKIANVRTLKKGRWLRLPQT